MRRTAFFAVVMFGVLACGSSYDSAEGAQPIGAERGRCFANGTCNAGLHCISETCVRNEVDAARSEQDAAPAMEDAATTNDGASDVDASGPATTNDAGERCPGAEILHPGTETRPVNTSVPFRGRGRDAACASVRNARLVWIDSFNGATIGTGEDFKFTFTATGTHRITLTPTGEEAGPATASITLTIE